MLWGFQMSFVVTFTFSVLTLYFLYVSAGHKRFKEVAFLAALASATVASFSSAQGLLVWPAGLLQLSISAIEKPTKKVLIGVWSLVGLGEWIFYFIGYVKPTLGCPPSCQNGTLDYILQHPIEGI